MKKLLGILVLGLFLITPSQADDIRDFQIEGMSVGDSLLDYYNKDKIEIKRKFFKTGKGVNKEYSRVLFSDDSFKVYDRVAIYFKSSDDRYIIQSITGRNYYPNNIDDCYQTQNKIVKEIEKLIPKAQKKDLGTYKHPADPIGLSLIKAINFYPIDNSAVHIACYDFSKEKENSSKDRLSVSVGSSEYVDFQKHRAFK